MDEGFHTQMTNKSVAHLGVERCQRKAKAREI
jgi:hypothetical protein